MFSRDRNLPALLKEWAEWFQSAGHAGWSDVTPNWHMMIGYGASLPPPCSCPPTGLQYLTASRDVRALIDCMTELAQSDAAPYIAAVQFCYLYGLSELLNRTSLMHHQALTIIGEGEDIIAQSLWPPRRRLTS